MLGVKDIEGVTLGVGEGVTETLGVGDNTIVFILGSTKFTLSP
jgi:hypothetical protein